MAEAAPNPNWTDAPFASAGGTLSPLVAKVLEIIVETVTIVPNLESVQPDAKLVADAGMDELDRVDLTISLEEEFGLEISEAEARAWVTAGDVVTFVRERVIQGAGR